MTTSKNTYIQTATRLLVHSLKATALKLAAYISHGSRALRKKSWASFAIATTRSVYLKYEVTHTSTRGQTGTYITGANLTVYSYFNSQGHFNLIPCTVESAQHLVDVFKEALLAGRGVELSVGNSPIRIPYWGVVHLEPQMHAFLAVAKSQQFLMEVSGLNE